MGDGAVYQWEEIDGFIDAILKNCEPLKSVKVDGVKLFL